MARQFTPGPYLVKSGRAIVDPKGSVVGNAHARKRFNADGYLLDENTVIGLEDHVDPAEADANAYLLAASWELYTELCGLYAVVAGVLTDNQLDLQPSNGSPTIRQRIAPIRTIIEKLEAHLNG